MKEQKNGLGTAGLVLGIISLCIFFIFPLSFLCGLLGLIFGIVAYKKCKMVAPIVLSCIGVGLSIIIGIITIWTAISLGNLLGGVIDDVNKEANERTAESIMSEIQVAYTTAQTELNGEYPTIDDVMNKLDTSNYIVNYYARTIKSFSGVVCEIDVDYEEYQNQKYLTAECENYRAEIDEYNNLILK